MRRTRGGKPSLGLPPRLQCTIFHAFCARLCGMGVPRPTCPDTIESLIRFAGTSSTAYPQGTQSGPPVRLAVPEKHFGLTLSPPCRNAIPGPASLRPANGAAAEIAGSLPLPPAAGASNSSCFSTAAGKEPSLILPQAARGLFSPVRGEGFATPRGQTSSGCF